MTQTTIIPTAALSQHVAILGKTGSGKTFAAKGIVEGLLDEHRQVCIIDPTGAWWGLRLGRDGKSKGYDVLLLGGEHGDIPLSERSGDAVARLVTQQRVSAVLDTSGMTVGEYTRWFIEFAGTLYTTIRAPLHLVIDEAHYFAPQSGGTRDPQAARMLHACNRLMSGGRSRGIRAMLLTQRPAKLHKDSLTCASTLIAMRVMAPQPEPLREPQPSGGPIGRRDVRTQRLPAERVADPLRHVAVVADRARRQLASVRPGLLMPEPEVHDFVDGDELAVTRRLDRHSQPQRPLSRSPALQRGRRVGPPPEVHPTPGDFLRPLPAGVGVHPRDVWVGPAWATGSGRHRRIVHCRAAVGGLTAV